MKTNYSNLFLLITFLLTGAFAQAQVWCVPVTAIPYAASMPGITKFTLDSIERTSSDLENYPNNSYVYSELTTTLVQGQTYSTSIAHTIDALICPDMNLRIWIDYNQNGSFGDVGELVITENHHLPGTYTAEFTVPTGTVIGATRMRVMAKMSNLGGHTLPTPCDMPVDPLGFHGEIEDYTVNLVEAPPSAATEPQDGLLPELSLSPNPTDGEALLVYHLAQASPVAVEILDLTGRQVATATKLQMQSPGAHRLAINASEMGLAPGAYFVAVSSNGQVRTAKLFVNN